MNGNKSIGEVIHDLKVEGKEFLQTRVEMLKTEMKEKVSAWKTAVPMFAVAAVMAATAWLVLTACLVTLVAQAFVPSRWAYALATLIVGAVYLAVAAVAAWLGVSEVRRNSLRPERTLRMLKQDQAWLQNETRKAA